MVYRTGNNHYSGSLKPFHWKAHPKAIVPDDINRPAPDTVSEILTGTVLGKDASDIEERLYSALCWKFGTNNVEFQPSYLGPANLANVVPDFAVKGRPLALIIYADADFTHRSAATKAADRVKDARLFQYVKGWAEFPVRIPGEELATHELARATVERRW